MASTVASSESQEDRMTNEWISATSLRKVEEGGKKKGYARRHTRSISFAPRGDERAGEGERRGCVAAGLSDTRETARKFSGPVSRLLFDLRLFYIYATTTSSQLGWISRLDTLSAADNLLALRAQRMLTRMQCSSISLVEEIKE